MEDSQSTNCAGTKVGDDITSKETVDDKEDATTILSPKIHVQFRRQM